MFGSSALVAGFVGTETTATAQVAQTLFPLHTESDIFVTETVARDDLFFKRLIYIFVPHTSLSDV